MIIVKTKNAFTRYTIRIIVTLIIAFIKHNEYNKRFKILYHSIDCKYFKEIYILY